MFICSYGKCPITTYVDKHEKFYINQLQKYQLEIEGPKKHGTYSTYLCTYVYRFAKKGKIQ